MTEAAGKRQRLDLRVVGLLAVMALPFLCALLAALGMLDPEVRRTVHILAAIVPYLVVAIAVVAMLYALGFALTDIVRRWHLRHAVFPTVTGMFPLVKGANDWFDATPDAVKAVAAWTHAQAANGVRPTAAATRAALYGPPVPALPAPQPATRLPEPVTSPDPFDIDPARSPHILIVGKTGSGKSTLARHLLKSFTRRYPSEVIVCDPDGVNWLDQCSASSTEGIAGAVAAVHGEFTRRQTILSDGGDPAWSYLILLVEETETMFERLAFAGDDVEDTARFQLREVARMGRKAGVFLWAVTQVAAGDIFDLHVRRNMTLFVGLSEPGVGRMLGVPKEIDLTRLAPGMVFASTSGQVLRFPAAASVRLPLSPLYHEWAQPQPVVQPQPAPTALISTSQPVVRLEPGRQPTPQEAQHMRMLKARGWSQNRIIFAYWGYKDQIVNDLCRNALEGNI